MTDVVGGASTLARYGVDHFRKAGKLGGQKVARDREYMRELGRIGGRSRKKVGRLSFEVAEEIRRLYRSSDGWTQEALAAQFGVSAGHIGQIVRGKVWASTES